MEYTTIFYIFVGVLLGRGISALYKILYPELRTYLKYRKMCKKGVSDAVNLKDATYKIREILLGGGTDNAE